jgi:hypothetical protein
MKSSNKLRLVLYLLAFALALAYPLHTIVKLENRANISGVFSFKVAAYDPYDIMRGRYMALRVLPDRCKLEDDSFNSKKKTYLRLGVDQDGFAEILGVSNQKPANGPFLALNGEQLRSYEPKGEILIYYPFNKFYLNEKIAKEADAEVRRISAASDGTDKIYLQVAILKDGSFKVDNLYINDKTIRQHIEQKDK